MRSPQHIKQMIISILITTRLITTHKHHPVPLSTCHLIASKYSSSLLARLISNSISLLAMADLEDASSEIGMYIKSDVTGMR